MQQDAQRTCECVCVQAFSACLKVCVFSVSTRVMLMQQDAQRTCECVCASISGVSQKCVCLVSVRG